MILWLSLFSRCLMGSHEILPLTAGWRVACQTAEGWKCSFASHNPHFLSRVQGGYDNGVCRTGKHAEKRLFSGPPERMKYDDGDAAETAEIRCIGSLRWPGPESVFSGATRDAWRKTSPGSKGHFLRTSSAAVPPANLGFFRKRLNLLTFMWKSSHTYYILLHAVRSASYRINTEDLPAYRVRIIRLFLDIIALNIMGAFVWNMKPVVRQVLMIFQVIILFRYIITYSWHQCDKSAIWWN